MSDRALFDIYCGIHPMPPVKYNGPVVWIVRNDHIAVKNRFQLVNDVAVCDACLVRCLFSLWPEVLDDGDGECPFIPSRPGRGSAEEFVALPTLGELSFHE